MLSQVITYILLNHSDKCGRIKGLLFYLLNVELRKNVRTFKKSRKKERKRRGAGWVSDGRELVPLSPAFRFTIDSPQQNDFLLKEKSNHSFLTFSAHFSFNSTKTFPFFFFLWKVLKQNQTKLKRFFFRFILLFFAYSLRQKEQLFSFFEYRNICPDFSFFDVSSLSCFAKAMSTLIRLKPTTAG